MMPDGDEAFDVLRLEPAAPRAAVLFSVGAGGDPRRHLPLLEELAAQGCVVAAPSLTRLATNAPTRDELTERLQRLEAVLDALDDTALTLVGVGHSIGAMLLLVLAGGEARTLAGDVVRATTTRRFSRLALMAPATQFFHAPGALDPVEAQIAVWTGERDEITPPAQARFLRQALPAAAPMTLHLSPEAGHFSYMNIPPPHVTDMMEGREAFLGALAHSIAEFIAA